LKGTLAEQLCLPEKFSEQYSSLEQRVQTQLLKTRYLVERLQLLAKKSDLTPIQEKSTARNLLDLLKAKENEIESLKEKYGNARKQALTGITELADSATIEDEMNALARKMEVQQNDLEKAYFGNEKGLETMQAANILLRKEVREMQQVFVNYLAKTLELVTLLKKERDYAQKIFMETEHETMQLRSSYSKELLGLQEQKVSLKKEAEEKFVARMRKTENENQQQQQLISQLQSMLQLREKKLEEFEEKNTKLRLLLKTKEKHEAIKKAFLSKSTELEMQE
jgi:hypothetical protein